MILADTPAPPYYAVIFTSRRTGRDEAGYAAATARMMALAAAQPGYLGVETAPGITISYWRDEAAILAWKRQIEHAEAQANGRAHWYAAYALRVAKVERAYSFEA